MILYSVGEENNVPHYVDFHLIDCCDLSGMKSDKRLDILYHCAATAHESLSVFLPPFNKNIFDASVTTFSAAISSGIKRIVFCSSMADMVIKYPHF